MKTERTLIILKPDAVQRGLIGEIIKRVENKGLKICAFKFNTPTKSQVFEHYNKDNTWFLKKGQKIVDDMKKNNLKIEKDAMEYGKDIIRALAEYMSSGPVLSMVIAGSKAVDIVTKMVGGTEPLTSDIGTIRGDFCIDSYELATISKNRAVRNLIHCSECPKEAEREIKVWFKDDEIVKYKIINEKILYDVNLDGILE